MKTNFRKTYLVLTLIHLSAYLIGQNNIPLNQEILISKFNSNGLLDTFNLIGIIDGTDTKNEFVDQKGDTINYLSFKDKVVLLDFWFLNCPPCIVELPGLELIKKKIHSEAFDLITFANDSFEEINEKLLSKKDFKIRIVSQVFLVSHKSYPLKLLINKQAKIIDAKNGGNKGSKSVSFLLEKYLPLIKQELKK